MKTLVLGITTVAATLLAPADFRQETVQGPQSACEPFHVPRGVEFDDCVRILEWSTRILEEELQVHRVPKSGDAVGSDGSRWTTLFTPFCTGNTAGDYIVMFDMCQAAVLQCRHLGRGDMSAMYMELVSIENPSEREVIGPICFLRSGSMSLVPLLEEMVEVEIGPSPPPILLQPSDAIVNLPMIASTEARQDIVIELDDPVTGTLTATPEYVWNFGDGSVGYGPGLPYDGTSPRGNPGYYVDHTYRELGIPTVGLAVTWHIRFVIPGYLPFTLDEIVRSATTTTTVRSAMSELIGG